MQYIALHKDYFSAFIANEDILEYCHRKAQDRVWGDDIELQALSEIYDRSIEILAYSCESMRTFHESNDDNRLRDPIRLSYHGKNHYNSVVKLDWSFY